MKIDSFACDMCSTQKKDANHWFRGYLLMGNKGIVVIEWNATPTADDVEDVEIHLCGANCVAQWVSKNLGGSK